MKSTLFLVLWSFFFWGSQAFGSIEIYVNGHKFNSMAEYRASKAHTIVISQDLSESTRHKLYVLSVEKGVIHALQESFQGLGEWNLPLPRKITPGQLEGALQEAVTSSKAPKLLIAEPGKLRLMALTDDTSEKSPRLAAGQ